MFNSSIWPIDRTLADATTMDQSGPGNSDIEGVLHIPQSSTTGASITDCFISYPGDSFTGGLGLPFLRETVGLFYSPSWLGYILVLE